MDKIKSLKVKQADGTLSAAIALGADATNVDLANGSNVETAITKLQSNEIFVMEKSNLDFYQGRTIEFNLYNQELIDLIAFCKEHQKNRDFNDPSTINYSYDPFPVIMSMTTDMGISKKTMLSLYYFEGDSMVDSFGYQRVMYFDTQDIIGSLMQEDYGTCRFAEALLLLGVSDSVINNPTAYTTISTFQEEGAIQGYGKFISLAQANNVYTKTEINDLIGNLSSLNIEVVTTLPTTNISSSTIYLVARENGDAQNVYEEYIYVNNKWEMIGTTEIDTSSFDEVHVGSDAPTTDSVEIWIDPNGEASEDNVDAYTKAEIDAKITTINNSINQKATKSTTLSGYGITNAYTKAEIDAKFTALASQYIKQVDGTTTALWMGTKAQYDAITTKDATTTYIIQGEE